MSCYRIDKNDEGGNSVDSGRYCYDNCHKVNGHFFLFSLKNESIDTNVDDNGDYYLEENDDDDDYNKSIQ
ncbi:hypothetical protein DERP_012294 [Dermatophagoides pteronyssinus]|uniref:Uncharacterized protein n=1 Tax=Dermatophagoides pteronyssinus TaxID=6956 RepID=A0ABQ8JQC2_DERPT|nr:hypothetical protein DERP_012294 [Dermatophagoides pteronyssinus]